MGKFICSSVAEGLQGFENLVDISELQGGDISGGESLVDVSTLGSGDILGAESMSDASDISIV